MSLALVKPYEPTPDDIRRELKMQDTLRRYDNARAPALKHRLWNKYRSLHNQRPAEYVAWLERKMGLNRGK